jgi:hypothetical protein
VRNLFGRCAQARPALGQGEGEAEGEGGLAERTPLFLKDKGDQLFRLGDHRCGWDTAGKGGERALVGKCGCEAQ